MLRGIGAVVGLLCFTLCGAAQGQLIRAELEQKIELKGSPRSRVPIVTAVAIHPSGQLLATAGDDHLVRLWDMNSARQIAQLRGHRDWVTSIAFCTDGRELMSGSRDRRVLLWDVRTGHLQGTLGQHDHPISAIEVGLGERVAIVGFRAPLKLYDLAKRRLDRTMQCPCSDTRAVTFSSDLRFLAAAGRNGKIRVWDLQEATEFDIKAEDRRIRALQFLPGTHQILSAGDAPQIRLWSVQRRALVHTIPHPSGKVLSLALIGEDQFAAAATDNKIRLFYINAAKPHSILEGHTGSIAALTARDGKLISGSFDTTVGIWALRRGGQPQDGALSSRIPSSVSPH